MLTMALCMGLGCLSAGTGTTRTAEMLAVVPSPTFTGEIRKVAAAPAVRPQVAYNCQGLLSSRHAPAATPGAAVELAALLHDSERGTPLTADRIDRAIANVSKVAPSALGLRTRIVTQSAALRLARTLGEPHTKKLVVIAETMALPASVLEALGDRPEAAALQFLGPESTWIDRRTVFCGSSILLHDRIFGGLLSFRPIRTEDKRALIAQIVAFDTEHRPHVTPVVQTIELRTSLAVDAPACIVERDPHEATLSTVSYDDTPHSMFVRKIEDGGFGCRSCHAKTDSFGLSDLSPKEAGPIIAGRKARMLLLSERTFAELRAPGPKFD